MKSLIENKKLSLIIIIISIIAMITLTIYSNNRIKSKEPNNNETSNEKETPNGEISLDSIFNNLDISLSTEEIPDFIDSSSVPETMNNQFIGAMLNEKISNEYKLIYTINRATWKAFDKDYSTMENNYGNTISIKTDTIKKLASQIFSDFEMPEELPKDYHYQGIYNLVCTEESCYYTYEIFCLINIVNTGYKIKTTYNNNIATSQAIYIEYNSLVSVNDESDTLTADITLKNSYNGNTISSYENYTFKKETSPYTTYIFDEFSQYYEKIPTFEYTFDNSNVLLKVEEK